MCCAIVLYHLDWKRALIIHAVSHTRSLKHLFCPHSSRLCVFTLPIVSPVLGDDYSTTSTRVLFDTCDSSACVNLSVTDDSIAENVESFIITLKTTYPTIHLESVHGVVTIVDDDGMCIRTSKEGVGMTLCQKL